MCSHPAMIEPIRYDTGRPMLLVGIRRHHLLATAPRDIPRQWEDFMALLPNLPRVDPVRTYGVICSGGNEAMEYLCGAEVASFEGTDPSLGRVRILEQHYAVFLHEGPVSGIHRTWNLIFNEWLPRSGVTSAHAPDFEIHDERFDAAGGAGHVEIWFPVVPSQRMPRRVP